MKCKYSRVVLAGVALGPLCVLLAGIGALEPFAATVWGVALGFVATVVSHILVWWWDVSLHARIAAEEQTRATDPDQSTDQMATTRLNMSRWRNFAFGNICLTSCLGLAVGVFFLPTLHSYFMDVTQTSRARVRILDAEYLEGAYESPGVVVLVRGDVKHMTTVWIKCEGQTIVLSDYPDLQEWFRPRGEPGRLHLTLPGPMGLQANEDSGVLFVGESGDRQRTTISAYLRVKN